MLRQKSPQQPKMSAMQLIAKATWIHVHRPSSLQCSLCPLLPTTIEPQTTMAKLIGNELPANFECFSSKGLSLSLCCFAQQPRQQLAIM